MKKRPYVVVSSLTTQHVRSDYGFFYHRVKGVQGALPMPIIINHISLTCDILLACTVLKFVLNLPFAAAQKSVFILSKFCGDEVYEDTNESLKVKSYKKHKKQMNKEKAACFNSAGMRTRAQKGTSKVIQT